MVLALMGAVTAHAQLDETCTVSAVNRSAHVERDGTWVLPNVPANAGRVRVRATCVADGITRRGQSDLVAVPPDGVIQVAEIAFDAAVPAPASLRLFIPQAPLTVPGETRTAQVTARLPDDVVIDVTAGATGTVYRVSNDDIVTVSTEGVVTAVTSGVALVSASYDGAVAMARVTVRLGGDSDGDGLPDDFELANGLDPNDPADAFTDPDGDGLSIIDEFMRGLDPFDADTDDDGLADGDEVNEVGSDPLVADTDGDGVADGLEVQVGSDPLDAMSVLLDGIVVDLAVSPDGDFTLVFDTALGESSRQLEATATLVDGTVLDVTSRVYGTQYVSSDLAVVNFGADDGRVFAGTDGTATVTVTNAGFEIARDITVASFAPTALSYLPLPGFSNAIALGPLGSDQVFVAGGQAGLIVVDVADPVAPAPLATLSLASTAKGIDVVDGLAYVAADTQLAIVDVSIPTAPRLLSTLPVGGSGTEVSTYHAATGGAFAVVAAEEAGIHVVDVSDPVMPFLLATLDTPGKALAVDISEGGRWAVVADFQSGLAVIDLADLATPSVVGTTATSTNGRSGAGSVKVRDGRAYVGDGGAGSRSNGIRVVDISTPDTPVVIGASGDAFGTAAVALDRQFVLTADFFFPLAVPIFNVGVNPPFFQALLRFDGPPPSLPGGNGFGIVARDGLIYLVGGRWPCCAKRAVGTSGLYIGQYLSARDSAGIAPTVAVAAPADGAQIPDRRSVTIVADAEDDIRLDHVRFSLDGIEVGRDYQAPFTWTTGPLAEGAGYTISATAVDQAGNATEAAPITIDVIADDTPTVSLRSPRPEVPLTEGTIVRLAASATDDLAVTLVEIEVGGVVVASPTIPPYTVDYAIPPGTTSLQVLARATDDGGQEAVAGPVTVPVLPESPPSVFILDPETDGSVVDGSVVPVFVAANDNAGVTAVELLVDGVVVATDTAPPYVFNVAVPMGAVDVVLMARATDTVGQTSTSDPVVVNVTADPGTTVVGTVVDVGGAAVAGADVGCAGVLGSTAADGTFAVPGVSTAGPLLSCVATVTQGATTLVGQSAPVQPVAGATTSVGRIVLASRDLVYVGTGEPSAMAADAGLALFDHDQARLMPWSTPGALGGSSLNALVFLPNGRLLGTIDGDGGSQLAELDAKTGTVLGVRGPVVDDAGVTLAIADLAHAAVSDRLYGLEANGTTLYEIAAQDARAVPVGVMRPHTSGGIAIGVDGLLTMIGDDGRVFMDRLDPGTGTRLATADLGPSLGAIVGVTIRPGGGFLFVAGGTVFELAPGAMNSGTAAVTPIATPDATAGSIQALASHPVTNPVVTTTVVGVVADDGGNVLPGVDVFTLGAATVSGSDGAFAFSSLPVFIEAVRAHAVGDAGEAVSDVAILVADGVTDVGILALGGATVGDRVWLDQDGDGFQNEPAAAGLADLRVTLRDDLGVLLDETRTNADGAYRFRGLAAGSYAIDVTTPPNNGQLTTGSLPLMVTVAEGETYLDADIGYRIVIDEGMGTIGQRVWHDLNGDGADPSFSEPGLDGVTVFLEGDVDGDGLADYFAQTTTGNGLGFYFFGDLPPGTYLVRVDATTLPTGITQPTHDFDGISTPHKATVAVGPGSSVFDVNFGYRAAP